MLTHSDGALLLLSGRIFHREYKVSSKNFKEFHRETAREFLDLLTPGENEIESPQFIYRGQADGQWRLEPSALRSNGQLTTRSLFGTETPTPKEQAHFED